MIETEELIKVERPKNPLEEILERLDAEGIDYRVVGSIAISAYLKEDLKSRDIDILCLSGSSDKIRTLQAEFDLLNHKAAGALPRVDLGRVIFSEGDNVTERVDHVSFLPQILSNIGKNKEGYFLVYNKLRKRIKEELIEPKAVGFNGTFIKTVPPETLLHLYLLRGGHLKPKDISKLRRFARFIRNNKTPGLTHNDFEVFHQFSERMRADYPIQTRLFRFLTSIDYSLGGFPSKSFTLAKRARNL